MIIWGSELSPFTLKVIRLFRHARRPFRFLPPEGSWLENWRYLIRLERLKRGHLSLTWPRMTADDELPLVPFVFGADGTNLYDSTAIAHWLDRELAPEQRFVPADPAAAFVVQLIDDYADEFLLYVVHHNRWVVSAGDNDAGARLAREYRQFLGPLQPVLARRFSERQTRRLPYLFSVAPAGFQIGGLPPERQPPSRASFPATHALLDEAYLRLIDALEALLAQRPYLLGGRFTLADAAIYGQLGMNLSDPAVDAILRVRPALHRWLTALHGADAEPITVGGELALDDALRPLLTEICRVHVPLMRQNAAAHARLKRAGVTRFNEAAFDRREALYDGLIDTNTYRSVAKSFQAKVWNDCLARWAELPAAARAQVETLLPPAHGLVAA